MIIMTMIIIGIANLLAVILALSSRHEWGTGLPSVLL